MAALRAGVFAVAFLPLVVAGEWGWPPHAYPFVTARHFAFRALLVVLLVGTAAAVWLRAVAVPRLAWPLRCAVAFVVIAGAANALGPDPQLSTHSTLERMGGTVGLLGLLVFALLARVLLDAPRWWRRLAWTSVCVCALVAGSAVVQAAAVVFDLPLPRPLAASGASPAHVGAFRADAWIGSPVELGVYAMVHVFVAVWLSTTGGRPARYAGRGLALLLALSVWLSGTRSAQLGLLVGVGLAGAHVCWRGAGARARTRWIVGGAVAAMLALVGFALAGGAIEGVPGLHRLLRVGDALALRGELWRIGGAAFAERPWWGWGQEAFYLPFDRHYSAALVRLPHWFDHPHHVLLGWFVATGVLGGGALLTTLVLGLRTALGQARSGACRGLLWGAVAAVAVFSCFNPDVWSLELTIAAWLAAVDGRCAVAGVLSRRIGAALAGAAAVAAIGGFYALQLPAWHTARDLGAALARPAGEPDMEALRRAESRRSFARREAQQLVAYVALTEAKAGALPVAARHELLTLAERALSQRRATSPPSARVLLVSAQLANARAVLLRDELADPEAAADAQREALVLLEDARQRSPGRPIVWRYLGRTYAGLGNVDRALECLAAAFAPTPHDSESGFRHAALAARHGRLAEARATLDVLYPPGTHRLLDQRLLATLRETRRLELLEMLYRRVLPALREASARGPGVRRRLAVASIELSGVLMDLGKTDEAVATLRTAAALAPEFGDEARAVLARIEAAQRR